jgi:hypothetical protein
MKTKPIRSTAASAVVSQERSFWQKFGKTEKEWAVYKAEARAHMIERAAQRAMITYGDLATRMTTVSVEPHDQMLWEIIGDVARDEAEANRGLLSVVVVHKNGDMEPGPGFFELAKYFGRKTADKTKCFIEELHRVHAGWSLPKDRTISK